MRISASRARALTNPTATSDPLLEHDHAVLFIKRIELASRINPVMAKLFHVPNGGHRSKATAGKLRAEGTRKGVLDYYLLVPRDGFHGLAFDLKRLCGQVSTEQRDEIQSLRFHGYMAGVAHGHEEAFDAVELYLQGRLEYRTDNPLRFQKRATAR